MQAIIAVVVGLLVSAPVVAEPLVEGRVRLASGQGVAAQVMVFDLTDLRRGAVARATTDADGQFALPLAALGGTFARPQGFALGQNYPNPFNPATIIPYQLPTATHVRLEVFNVLGQHLATLVNEVQPAGFHTARWDATNAAGQAVGAGVYFYRLRGQGVELTRRMVLIDGQAGTPAAVVPAPARASAAAEQTYGLVIAGAGVVPYVDAAFAVRPGMAPVEVVVEGVTGLPRGKALTGGLLGDVNGDGQVNSADALLLMAHVTDASVQLPSPSLGDVNGDGQVNLVDALLLTAYVVNPADPSLPDEIGQAVPSNGGDWVAGAIRRLTSHSGDDHSPSWSLDGQQIVFRSYRDGNNDIYVMASDGTNQRRLTTHSANDYSPSWSPDGQQIAFRSNRDGNYEIYVMGSDGTNVRRLTTHSAHDLSPSWSPDGQQIAFRSNRDDNLDIYVMGSDGGNLRRLTTHGADDWFPSWSPDGQHIAFISERDDNMDIYVMDSDGGNLRRLTTHSAHDRGQSWSPDGQQIAFRSNRDGNYEIYVMGSDGGNLRRLTSHAADDGFPVWSPDGQHIAFTSYRDGNWEIYVMGSDGGNVRRLTTHSAADLLPSWSPDGQQIAFESERDGNDEIYVMELREAGSDGLPDLVVDSPSVRDSTLTPGQSFTLTATVRNLGPAASASTTLRYYRSSDATIASSDSQVGTDSVPSVSAFDAEWLLNSIPLTAPSSEGTYYYGACVDAVSGESNTDNNCSTGVRVTVGESTSFDLDSDNDSARGITYADNRFYVVDSTDDKVYVYSISGERIPSADFNLDSDNGSATGIIDYEGDLFVIDISDDWVYVYSSSGQYLGGGNLGSDNGSATGTTYANNRFYAVDSTDDKVYVYSSISSERVPSADFDLSSDNDAPWGYCLREHTNSMSLTDRMIRYMCIAFLVSVFHRPTST